MWVVKTLNHHNSPFGAACLFRCFVFSFPFDTVGDNMDAYIFGRVVCTAVGVGSMFFGTDGAVVSHFCAVLTFRTLVS